MTIASWTQEWANSKFLNNRFLPETKSTNDYVKSNLPEDEFELVLTDHQTAGRGRGSNKWIDTKPGSTLLSTWVFQSIKMPQPITTPLIGLAAYHAALKVWPSLKFSMKAPNDLYCDDKKIAGILVETVNDEVSHYLLIGLGINVMSHPGVDASGCIADFAGEDLTREHWFRFLDFFKGSVDAALFEFSNATLSDRKRVLLLEALNKFPLLDNKYVEVLPDGSLKTSKGTIPWTRI
jgi:BirA family transcriptional regulator, biotin operon repressor / biotin---[acetyl-CoA-carboxylase] ligase